MTFKLLSLPLVILVGLVLVVPSAHAASLQVSPVAAGVGQEFPIEVRLIPEGEQINAVEGSLVVPEGLNVVRISTGGSVLSVWPTQPTFSPSTRTISFVGGIPGTALSTTDRSLLFTVYVQATAAHTYSISAATVSGFRADGTGDRIAVRTSTVEVPITATPVSELSIPADHTPPTSVSVALGSDTALFGGAPFVSFFGTDAGSGIVQYQAKEGWFGAYEPVAQYYVLRDGTANTPVWIRAIDAGHNARTVHVPGTGTIQLYLVPVIALIVVAGIIGGAFFILHRLHRTRRTHRRRTRA